VGAKKWEQNIEKWPVKVLKDFFEYFLELDGTFKGILPSLHTDVYGHGDIR